MPENQKNNPEHNLEEIEKEAFKIRSEGKTKLALEKLEQVIQREEKWYHHFYKVIWLWETNKLTDVAKVIEYGLDFNKGEEFYFRYLNAEALYRVITPKALQDIDNTIKVLDQAIIELNLADSLYNNYYPHVQDSRDKIPKELKELCPTFINDEDLIDKVRSLRTKIEMFRQFSILANAGIQSENRVKRV